MPSLADWTTYTRWNAAIVAEFFSGRYGGRPVYIDLEDDSLARIGEAVELEGSIDPQQGLIAAVAPTLGLGAGESLFGKHVGRLRTWRRNEQSGAPPIVAVLALQSLVAEGMRSDEDFRASNYYGRFLQTLGLDVEDQRMRSKVIRGFGADSGDLWGALNRWIAEDSVTRGIPTAYSFDRRVRVGLPMSQALVRASDRSAIRTLFGDLGLRPGQAIAAEDMVRLLEAWLPESRVSRGLKILCASEHAARRVAEVACIELQAWSGAVERPSVSSRSMALTATLRRLPRRSLSIGLSVRAPEELDELFLEPDSDEAAAAAVGASGGRLALGQLDDEGWRAVVSELSTADLLFARLRVGNGELRAGRDPRTLVVLAKPSDGGPFREADRVRLGSEHLLLAAEPVRQRVERELAAVARPGFRVHERLPGLPAGWIAYERVEIVAISDTSAADLGVLVPLAWTEVTVEGGLRLPGRGTWHSAAPPEIRASAPAGRVVALAVMREGVESAEEPETEEPETEEPEETEERSEVGDDHEDDGSAMQAGAAEAFTVFEETAILDLSELGVGDGNFRVELFDGSLTGRALGAMTFHLRSSSTPFYPVLRSTLSYATDEPLGAISAHADQEGVQGARIPDAATGGDELSEAGSAAEALAARGAPSDDEDEPEPPAGLERQSSAPECFVTGAHYFVLESTRRGRRGWEQTFEGECKHCGLEKSFPARPRRRGAPQQAAAGRLSRAAEGSPVPVIRDEQPLDHDLLLDALCCVGAGTMAALEQLVGQRDDRPWAAREVARALVSLGHVDIELDSRMAPCGWSISPPTLVASAAGAFLAGWRSPELLLALGLAAQAAGGRVERSAQAGGPSRVAVVGLDGDRLEEVASRLSESVGLAVEVAAEVPLRLAGALGGLPTLRRGLPVIAAVPVGAQLERLDVDSLRWVGTTSGGRPGAYRTTQWPRVVMHADGYDIRRADARLAKWLAAAGTPLLAHDRASGRAVCHRGTEPPGLYERALVLCSGLLPTPVEGHLVEYVDVPVRVASALTGRLSAAMEVNA
jgi:hypothetical protein